jgi:outer membrane autotransporter protein
VDAGASNGAFYNVNGVNKVIGGQLASGSETAGKHLWLKGFGSTADQDKVDGISGYQADTFGAVLGADKKFFNDSTTLGVALSYSNISVDSDNAARTNTDIDSYQASLYGDHKFGNNYFVEGIASYGLQKIDSQRVNIDGVGTNANADYNANVYSARAQVGRDFAVGTKGKFTPSLISQYAAFDGQKYTETGAGTANLTVDTGIVQRLDMGVGMRYAADLRQESGSLLRPSVNVNYLYDVIGDQVSSNSTFQGGGGSFVVRGADYERGRVQAGLGLDYFLTGNWQFSGRYDFEGNSEYQSHGGSLRASYNF